MSDFIWCCCIDSTGFRGYVYLNKHANLCLYVCIIESVRLDCEDYTQVWVVFGFGVFFLLVILLCVAFNTTI